MGRPKIDLDGQIFGKLVATNTFRVPSWGCGREHLCYCACGKEAWVQTNKLLTGHTHSCGCWLMEFKLLSVGLAARNEVLCDYKLGAKKRNLEWCLTDKQFDEITCQNCFYCGIKPSNRKSVNRNGGRKNRLHSGDFIYNGIDRMDNKKGYLLSNVVPCCKICNRAKSGMSFDSFITWIQGLRQYVHSL